MAVSARHSGLTVVPWFNSKEWESVNTLIFGPSNTNATKQAALDILNMWQIRTPELPVGVAGTLIVIDALLATDGTLAENQLRKICGISIVRFINVCGVNRENQDPFYQTDQQNNLPDWVFDLRHDVAHNSVMPSLYMLKRGLQFCLNWLKCEYWDKQSAIISDYIANIDCGENLKRLADLYCQIKLIWFLNKHVDTIQGILLLEPSLKEGLCAFNEFSQIDMDEDVNNVLMKLFKMLHECIGQQGKLKAANIISDVMMLRIIYFRVDIEVCHCGTERIPKDFMNIWQDFINLLYLESLLISLVEKLVSCISSIEDVTDCDRKNASLWFAEILKSLLFAKTLINRYNDINNDGNLNIETAKTKIEEYVTRRNPDLNGCLNLDFRYYCLVMSSVDFLRIQEQALLINNDFGFYFWKYLLRFGEEIKKGENKSIVPSTCYLSLQNTIKNITACVATPSTISESVNPQSSESANMDVSSPTDHTEAVGNQNSNQHKQSSRRWRIVEDTSIYAGCPLGVLSFQDRNVNPALPKN